MKLLDTEDGLIVALNKQDREKAEIHGHLKHDKSEREGRRADWYDGTERDNHADGVGGEMAFSHWLHPDRVFVPTIDNFKGPDVGSNYEIRSTKCTWFDLKVKDRDKDHRIAVGLRQLSKHAYLLIGWLTVAEAKRLGEKKDPGERDRPAYFVSPGQLHPMSTIPKYDD